MRITFSNGIAIEVNFEEEIKAHEFTHKMSAIQKIIAAGLKSCEEIEEFDEEHVTKKKRRMGKQKDFSEVAKEVERLRRLGFDDKHVSLKMGKCSNYVASLIKRKIVVSRSAFEMKKIEEGWKDEGGEIRDASDSNSDNVEEKKEG